MSTYIDHQSHPRVLVGVGLTARTFLLHYSACYAVNTWAQYRGYIPVRVRTQGQGVGSGHETTAREEKEMVVIITRAHAQRVK